MRGIKLIMLALLSAGVDASGGPRIEQFAWLAGCWTFERDGTRYEEAWLPPTANGTLGMARAVKEGRTLYHEFTQLSVGDQGTISYLADPSGQKPASFPLKSLDGTRAVFENLQHDFPRRIVYQFVAPDRLDARIEGTRNGKDFAVDYPFRRAPCQTPAPTPKATPP